MNNKEIEELLNLVDNRLIETEEGYKMDTLIKEQILKKINAQIHNEELSEIILTGIVYKLIEEKE
jgi:hypothetical protein